MLTKAKFETELKKFAETLTRHVSTDDGQWTVKGFIDTFRFLNQGIANKYTWWSYRANARNNNKGWRIDYISANSELLDKIVEAKILPADIHSDHCASYTVLDF